MITSDWHIHSIHSCDSASLPMADLPDQAAAQGITDFGITDHLHSSYNLPDIVASRESFLALNASERFHFGIEISCMSQWELNEIETGKYENLTYGIRKGGPAGAPLAIALTEELIDKFGIEYVVAGTHWPMYAPIEREAIIRDYHRQNMFLATHPLTTIIAHPWWWLGPWADEQGNYNAEPWFDSFKVIPESFHDEFASAVLENGKVVEINIGGMLLSLRFPESFKLEYLDYLAGLKARGVSLSIGSDCHAVTYKIDFARVEEMLATVGIRGEDCWALPPRTT